MPDPAAADVPPPRRAGPRLRLSRTEYAAALCGLLAAAVPMLLLLWSVAGRG